MAIISPYSCVNPRHSPVIGSLSVNSIREYGSHDYIPIIFELAHSYSSQFPSLTTPSCSIARHIIKIQSSHILVVPSLKLYMISMNTRRDSIVWSPLCRDNQRYSDNWTSLPDLNYGDYANTQHVLHQSETCNITSAKPLLVVTVPFQIFA